MEWPVCSPVSLYCLCSRNQLSALPACLCGLPLKVLIASNNKLGSLPEEIGQLKQLMELVCYWFLRCSFCLLILVYQGSQKDFSLLLDREAPMWGGAVYDKDIKWGEEQSWPCCGRHSSCNLQVSCIYTSWSSQDLQFLKFAGYHVVVRSVFFRLHINLWQIMDKLAK